MTTFDNKYVVKNEQGESNQSLINYPLACCCIRVKSILNRFRHGSCVQRVSKNDDLRKTLEGETREQV